MKAKYQAAVDRFILDSGGLYRFFNRRWWTIVDGYWVLTGRFPLERNLTGFIHAFTPHAVARSLDQADLNQIRAYLSRKLYTSALPALNLPPDQDQKLIMYDSEPRRMISDLPSQ